MLKILKNILFFGIIIFIIACQPTVRFTSQKNVKIKTSKNIVKQIKDNKVNKKNDNLYSQEKANSTILNIAEKWIGVKYKYGGDTKDGVDCSGFVKSVYLELGFIIPRTSYEQYLKSVPTINPKIGDLVFFKRKNEIYHVGIYIGDGNMIHSSSSSGVIKQSFSKGIFAKNYAGIRSIIY